MTRDGLIRAPGDADGSQRGGMATSAAARVEDGPCQQAAGRSGASLVRLPVGPYAGLSVDEVAVIDPDYLLGLLREEVGSVALRAAAGRALACRGRLACGAESLAASRLGRSGPQTLLPTGSRSEDGQCFLELRAPPTEPGGKACGEEGGRPFPTKLPVSRAWFAILAVTTVGLLAMGIVGGIGGRRPAPAPSRLSGSNPEGAEARGLLGPSGRTGLQMGAADGSLQYPEAAAPGVGETASQAAAAYGLRATMAAGQLAMEPDRSVEPMRPAIPCGQRSAGAIAAEAVRGYVDTFQAVEFEVVRTKDTGRVTYLNSHDPYQGHFYVAVFPGDYEKFSQPPAILFRGKCIVVQGVIEMYRGTPQIVLHSPEDVRILGDS